jgi:hypothetical protein
VVVVVLFLVVGFCILDVEFFLVVILPSWFPLFSFVFPMVELFLVVFFLTSVGG